MANLRPETRNSNLFQNAIEPKRLVIRLESSEKKEKPQFDNGDDLLLSNRKFLMKYVSDTSVNAGNSPAIIPDYNEVSHRNADGSPAALTDPSTNGQATFLTEGVTPEARMLFQKTSRTGMLDTDGEQFIVKRGKEFSSAPSPVDIFQDVSSKLDKSEFSLRVQTVLKNNNRNNESNPYWPKEGKPDDKIVVTTISNQKLGEYGGRSWPTATSDKTQQITIEDLKKTAIIIALKSTGETAAEITDILKTRNDPNSGVMTQAIGTAISHGVGLARIGQKVPVSRFESVAALQTMNPKISKPTSNSLIDTGGNLSYGNTNNMFVQFGAGNPMPSIISARLMFTTLLGLLKASVLTLPKPINALASQATAAERARNLGTSNGTPKEENRFLDFFGFTGLSFDMNRCLNEGIDVFFGSSQFRPGPDNRIDAESDYFNVILRNLYRSTSDFLVNPFRQNVNDVESAIKTGLEAASDNIFQIKEKLKGLPITKFIGVLLMLGERSLTLKNSGQITVQAGIYSIISKIDSIVETNRNDSVLGVDTVDPAVLIAKNRLDSRGGMSSIGNSTLKSLFLFPNAIESAAGLLQVGPGVTEAKNLLAGLNRVCADVPENVENGRLKKEIVEKMEDYLERDYVPFYFQDLRTNEIMPFHAFFDSMEESHTADYTENDYYGRIGSVPIYKNTKRSISLVFRVISVNEEDHEQMWYKLNRLVMMLYPQWSEGRKLEFRNNRLIQPFSQVPAAAPLIRMRVGDLWKSNYSKFNLSRLFGLTGDTSGDTTFRLASMTNTIPPRNRAEESRRYEEIVARMRRGEYAVGDEISISQTQDPRQQAYRIVDSLPSGGNAGRNIQTTRTGISYDTSIRLTSYAQASFRVVDVFRNNEGQISGLKIRLARGQAFMTASRTSERLAPGQRTPARQQRQQGTSDVRASGEFLISVGTHLRPNETWAQAQVSADAQRLSTNAAHSEEASNQAASNNESLISTFFSAQSNPIVRSFESTKGRGLAGFIKNMNLSMEPGETRWVTDTFGARAPMSIKISMEFLPIYDLYPGLDSRGFMTAPVWNVGKVMEGVSGRKGEAGYSLSRESFINGQTKIPS